MSLFFLVLSQDESWPSQEGPLRAVVLPDARAANAERVEEDPVPAADASGRGVGAAHLGGAPYGLALQLHAGAEEVADDSSEGGKSQTVFSKIINLFRIFYFFLNLRKIGSDFP